MSKENINQRILDKLDQQGTAIQENTVGLQQVMKAVQENSAVLKEHGSMIGDMSATLKEHGSNIRENSNDITTILDTLQTFSSAVDARFVKQDIRFDKVDKRLTRLEALMVTKDYLDEKLWDLRGDLVSMVRREIGRHEVRLHSA